MNKMYTKSGLVVKEISEVLFTLSEGDRIPKIEDLVKSFGVGRGTVQGALTFLQESGAVVLKQNGHMGTVLQKIDKKSLFEISGLSSIVGTMPLPYSKRYEGLATGLYQVFEAYAAPFFMSYQRGAQVRIEGVLQGRYDFAVCSRFAAEEAAAKNSELNVLADLGKGSYVGSHAVIYLDKENSVPREGLRVAVDQASPDQHKITEAWVGKSKVEYVCCSYNQILAKLRKREIDVAVWNADEIAILGEIEYSHVDLPGKEFDTNTHAAIISKIKKPLLSYILKNEKAKEIIVQSQELVLTDQILPQY